MMRLVVLAVLLVPIFGQKDVRQEANEILDQLLDKSRYDPRLRPINKNENNTDIATLVTTNVYVRNIEYICTKKQEWKVQITFRQQWNDPRLKFDDKQGQIKYLNLVDDGRIWKPDTFFTNSKATQKLADLQPNVLFRISPDGQVLFSVRMNTELSCPMDLKYYPFDKQRCGLMLASYGYTTEDILYQWKDDPIQVVKNLNLAEFGLDGVSTEYCTSRTITGEYSCIRMNLDFERESSRYVCQWFVPTAVLTLISFASFWLKPKSTRIRFLLAILVLLYLQILYINKSSANTSQITAKDCWVSTCMIFVVAAVVELGVAKLVDNACKRRKNGQEATGQNGKTHCEEGDAVAMKPLVEEAKDESKEEDGKQYTVNKAPNRRSVVQKFKEAPIGCRIDLLSAILFPVLFIVYVIAFFCYFGPRQ